MKAKPEQSISKAGIKLNVMSILLQLNEQIMKKVALFSESLPCFLQLIRKSLAIWIAGLMVCISYDAKGQYVSGDTSVCPGQTVTYNFSGGPFLVAVLGGGTLNPVPVGPVNSFTVDWGTVPGTYIIRLITAVFPFTQVFQQVIVEGDYAMACDDLVHVSLDGNCQALITPGVVLEGDYYPASSFQVTVYNTNNLPILGNIVNYSHLGQVLKVHVRHLCTGIACWGRILIEDKYIPLLECSDTAYIVECDEDYSPDSIGFPLPPGDTVIKHPTKSQCYIVRGFDLCCDVELCYYDIYTKNGCNAPYYAQIERNWTAVDCKGNKTSCKDSIYITQASIAGVMWPQNYDGFQLPPLQCDSIEPPVGPYPAGWNALDNGNPSPYDELDSIGGVKWKGTGYPLNVHCDHIAVTYRDIRIPICGNSFKLLRTWKVFDWCTGELEERVQFIKVMDNKPPVVACAQNYMRFPMDYYQCAGTAIVPPPQFIDDCSSTTFTVEYKLAGPDGKPEAGDYRTDGVTYSGGNAVIPGLPRDTTWVRYIVTDACGNVTRCRTEVLIEDSLDPVAICDEHTVVSLNEQGVATLQATSVDNGSLDNCEIDSMAVRRMTDWCGIPGNTEFGPRVTFCCEDLEHNPHMVVFRVWDKAGNFNDCMVSVTVQDKIAPDIDCPSNITVDCGTDLSDLGIVGGATAVNSCSNVRITYRDDTIQWKCGVGVIRREWKAASLSGAFTICHQTITVVDEDPITMSDIGWPADITVNGCQASDAHPEIAGKPKLPGHGCANLIAGYSDERFYNVGGYCIKIIRHWKVIDWCLYDVNSNGPVGIFSRDQLIYVRNTSAPTIANETCNTVDICADDVSCNAYLDLIGAADDDCTDDDKLIWTYRLDIGNAGFGSTQQGNNASGVYPVGTHRIEWTVSDSCGNTARCVQLIRVNDCKVPTPFCKVGLVAVVMPSSGNIDVPARFFDSKSQDNCTAYNDLRFSFSSLVSDSVRRYTCSDIDNGISDTLDVTIYVTDQWNNQSFCKTKLYLQDNIGNTCVNRFGNGGMISGLVSTSNQAVLQNAHLDLFQEGKVIGTIHSERSGSYSFVDLPEGERYSVRPRKDDDVSNGITTADIVLIQRHILGVESFQSPYQFIAADVNNSRSITASDISDIRKLILGINDRFKEGVPSWSFLTKDTKFDQIDNPWANMPWVDQYEIDQLSGEMHDVDFMAIKTGDVNLSAKTTEVAGGFQGRASAALSFELDEAVATESGLVRIPVYGSWVGNLAGFQCSFGFETTVGEFVGVQSGILEMDERNICLDPKHAGRLNASWNSIGSVKPTEQALFYFVFRTTQPVSVAEFLMMRHDGILAEAYLEDMSLLSIQLKVRSNKAEIQRAVLFQNEPNPFRSYSTIRFQAPVNQKVNISFFNTEGTLLRSVDCIATEGPNTMRIDAAELGGTGIYYYRMETHRYTAVRKIILTQ